MEKLYLFNVCTFCKSPSVINVGSPYMLQCGAHMYLIFIWSDVVGWGAIPWAPGEELIEMPGEETNIDI